MNAYDREVKERAVMLVRQGEPVQRVADQLGGPTPHTIYQWVRETGFSRQQLAGGADMNGAPKFSAGYENAETRYAPTPPKKKHRRHQLRVRDEMRDLLLEVATAWEVTQSEALERLILEGYERECATSDPRDEAKELFARLALVLKARVE